jgi:hypothetical protein
VYHLTLSFYGSACQHIEVSHGMKSVDQCSTAIQIQLDFDISRIAILLNISKHVLLPIQIVLVATILLHFGCVKQDHIIIAQPTPKPTTTLHPLPPLPLNTLIAHSPQQRRCTQSSQSHITINTNIHSLSVMARQRPVRVRTISRRDMMEHSSQNRKFGVRFPRT